MDIFSIKVLRSDFTMHLMQHLSHHLREKHLSRLTYERTPAKGSNPVLTRNRRIAANLRMFQNSLKI